MAVSANRPLLLVGVLVIRALLFGVCSKAPDFRNFQMESYMVLVLRPHSRVIL